MIGIVIEMAAVEISYIYMYFYWSGLLSIYRKARPVHLNI